jgi:U3 small nucleolar RNA-associated protein 13
VDQVIRTLSGPDLSRLLRYVRDWNANARTSTVAQRVLHAVLRLRRADDIVSAFDQTAAMNVLSDALATEDVAAVAVSSSKEGKGAGALRELVEALVPYTERHLARMEKLVQESYVVDYLLGEMDDGLFGLGEGEEEDEDAGDAAMGGGTGAGEDNEEEWGGMEVDVGAGVAVAA